MNRGDNGFFCQIIYVLTVMMLAVFLASCGSSRSDLGTPTIIPSFTPPATATPSATASRTLIPTVTRTPDPTGTWTPAPTHTQTPTATRLPTLTAAVPLVDNSLYSLADWDADRASELIDLLEQYPDDVYIRNRFSQSYYEDFRFAALAQSEAILRFPNSFQAPFWRQDLAFNLARSGDPDAGPVYASMVEEILESGLIDPAGLPEWFFELEPRMRLNGSLLDPLPGFSSTTLVEIEGSGSAFLLVTEDSGGFNVRSLMASFNFADPVSFDFSVADYTGDGRYELVVFQQTVSADDLVPLPQIFDLSSTSLSTLPFLITSKIDIGLDMMAGWRPSASPDGGLDLEFFTSLFPACPLEVRHRFRWTGEYFIPVEESYELRPDPALLSFCDAVVSHAAAHWGGKASRMILDPALNPPESGQDSSVVEEPLIDKWQFQLALFEALDGETAAALRRLQKLATEPRVADSPLGVLARETRSALQSADGAYRACILTEFCDRREAVAALVEDSAQTDPAQLMMDLTAAGVPVEASGNFDFLADRTPERWFTIRHEGELELEFWILWPQLNGWQPLYVGNLDTGNFEITVLDPNERPPAVQVGSLPIFYVETDSNTREFYLRPYRRSALHAIERMEQEVAAAQQALLNGTDPAEVRDALVGLQAQSYFVCPYYFCSEYIYTLALAYELSGDERQAVEQYLELWRSYSDDPLTIIVRFKLKGRAVIPTATPTPTPTTTYTPTITPTGPTPTRTPTVTLTLTPTSTATAISTSTVLP